MRVITYQARRQIRADARISAGDEFDCPCGCGTRQMVDPELAEKLQAYPGSGRASRSRSPAATAVFSIMQDGWRQFGQHVTVTGWRLTGA
ncbi:MAG: hypothetical protein ACLRRS_06580 [Faecalibacterium prausnitzii]